MKYKKQTSDRKRFWLGIASCAMVGFVAYATSYFSSAHVFVNEYKAKKYDVKVYDVFDSKKATGLWPNKKTEMNQDLVIKNVGNAPVLLRIKYVVGVADRETGEYSYLDMPGYSWLNQIVGSSDYTTVQNEDKFLFNGETGDNMVEDSNDKMDGYYYYKGILGPNESIQHLDSVADGAGNDNLDSYASEYLHSAGKEWNNLSWTNEGDHLIGKRMNAHLYPTKNVIRIYVETIQATDTAYKDIGEIPDNATAYDMRAYWDALEKEDSTGNNG